MFFPTDTLQRAARRAARALAWVAMAAGLACTASGDQLLGTILPEEMPIRADASTPTLVSDGGGACLSFTYPARAIGQNLAIELIVDRSLPMADPRLDKWDALVSGLSRFFKAGTADGTDIGVVYFPALGDSCNRCMPRECNCFANCGCPCDQHGDPPRNCQRGGMCDPNRYDRPDVEILPMPQNGSNLAASLGQIPMGPSTTRPALQGALDHAAWYQTQPLNQDERVVAVLVALNAPAVNECAPNSVFDCGEAAANSNIKTYVVAFNYDGPSLDPIFTKGGGKLFQFDSRRGDDITVKFGDLVQELARDTSAGCEYEVPANTTDPDKINVSVTSGAEAGSPTPTLTLLRVKSRFSCNGQLGWFYDRSDRPTRIVTCDAACRNIRNTPDAKVSITVGCPTLPTPP
jgi:hypothetical protein